ncbi:hypothetical protein Poli38472_002104 [Pythium oligandrum]|uniref:Uncharacterized protein n=1 Tax=Pythium oligandrum TaxID=41045 RepID=A0A8K1FLY8_PYTOL|nr:hypothetical protein Poli38472_002104 [Pythium oligandrum]|eukprot:TMW63163.1 hypothetical protein Poli38472_002104 [Pythium oligandrum]
MLNLLRRGAHAYENVQVELHGQYSTSRQLELQAYYENTSVFRVASVIMLTPLSCLLIVTLADVPTLQEPTSLGFSANYVYWVRGSVLVAMMAAFFLLVFRQYIDGLELRPYQVVLVGILTSLGVNLTTYNIAKVVGFPLPFIVLCSGPPFQFVMALCGAVLWGKWFYRNPLARKQLPNAVGIVSSQMTLLIVYPAYNSVFVKLQGAAQGAFVLLFPLIKIIMMNLLARYCREMQDKRPEILVMNVEIFHALYSTYCMQGSTSPFTVAVIMGADAVHIWLSLRDVNRQASEIQVIVSDNKSAPSKPGPQFPSGFSVHSPLQRVQKWLGIAKGRVADASKLRPPAQQGPKSRRSTREPKKKPSAIAPLPSLHALNQDVSAVRAASSTDQHNLSRQGIEEKVRRLLHLTEFVILVEYVEIITPVIYGIYVSICFHLPNRKFYPQLRDIDSDRLGVIVTNVFMYAALELVSLLVLSTLLRRKLLISPIYQLAFVLEKQWWLVQMKLTFWMLYVVMSTLEHSGEDYTFQFKWLHHPSVPRVACVLLLTPLPSVVIISLVDVPTLRDPADGVFANYVYWIRAGAVTVIMAAFFLLLFKEYIDGLSLRPYQVIVASLLTGLVVIALMFQLAQVIGFPLPFIVLCSGPPFVFVMVPSGVVLWGKVMYQDPVARGQLPNALGIAMSQWSLMIVYPAYNAVDIQLAGAAQAAFVFVLLLVKLFSINLLASFCRDMQDARAEIIVMNVEIFHALFSTYCMQGSTSSMTIAIVMVGDVIHAWLPLRDVNTLASEVKNADTYLAICFRLPNRQFYPQLRSIEPNRLSAILTNVLLYALLELASLVLLGLVLRRRLPVSPIYQLAFVLEKQWWLIQFKLSFWVIFVVMQTLEHSGRSASSIAILWGKVLYHNTIARRQLVDTVGIFHTQWSLILVYSAYNAVYIKLQGAAQTAFVLVFPVVKLLLMNLLARYARNMQDTRPEILVTNVEVFHALFSTCCMQGSTSSFTVAIIMGADTIHAWLSLRDINKLADTQELITRSSFKWLRRANTQ